MLDALGKLLTSVSRGAKLMIKRDSAEGDRCGSWPEARGPPSPAANITEPPSQQTAIDNRAAGLFGGDILLTVCGQGSGVVGTVARLATPEKVPAVVEKENLALHRHSLYHERVDKLAFRMHSVLTAEECQNLVTISEARGYSSLSAHRAVHSWVSADLAERLWTALRGHVSLDIWGCSVVGISERFVLYKDGVGFECSEYYDEVYERAEDKAVSFVSVWVDLNQDFDGGRLVFMKRSRPGVHDVIVEPRIGSVTVLQHNILHQKISTVTSGTKYTLRTDIMYSSSKQRQRTSLPPRDRDAS